MFKLFRKDNAKSKKQYIIQQLQLLYGKNWKQKIKPNKLRSIPFNNKFKNEYDRLMQQYATKYYTTPIKDILRTINNIATTRTDSDIDPDIESSEAVIAQIENIETAMEEALITFTVSIREIGKEMTDKNNGIFQKQLQSAFGFSPDFNNDPFYKNLDSWLDENVSLIQNVNKQTATRLKSIIRTNFRNGGRAETLIKEIQKTGNFATHRARLIARDQTAKLHGQITKRQQTSVGIERYIWQTSEDERVRSKHQALNGKKRKWGQGIEPGQEFQCRCTAYPVWED